MRTDSRPRTDGSITITSSFLKAVGSLATVASSLSQPHATTPIAKIVIANAMRLLIRRSCV
jgi:hypothetical protein